MTTDERSWAQVVSRDEGSPLPFALDPHAPVFCPSGREQLSSESWLPRGEGAAMVGRTKVIYKDLAVELYKLDECGNWQLARVIVPAYKLFKHNSGLCVPLLGGGRLQLGPQQDDTAAPMVKSCRIDKSPTADNKPAMIYLSV